MNHSIKSYGFTLIEVLIALVILSVAFLGLAGLMVQTTKNTSFGGLMTEAATFAQDKLEELRAASWGAITPGSDLIHVIDDGSGGKQVEVKSWVSPTPNNLTSSKDFDRKWTIVSNGNLNKNVTITINWNDKTIRSISLTSVIANPNPS